MRTLDTKCTECSGNGHKQSYKTVCQSCYGKGCEYCENTGKVKIMPGECSRCKGVGYIPTEYGYKMLRHRELVKFMHRHTDRNQWN